MAKKALTTQVVDRYVNLVLYERNLEDMPSGCTEWRGSVNNAGYGLIGFNYVDGKVSGHGRSSGMMTVHRLAFMIEHNRLPQQRNINHTCHNKLCCNPKHLTEGTQREKLDAMMQAGIKGGRVLGSSGYAYSHKQATRTYRYSDAEIQYVRTATLDDITERYGIDRRRAGSMRHSFRKGYCWLPCPEYTLDRPGRKSRKESK